ncbi:hypothetical protein [Thauera humireducens]|uniref:Uncharacterized protein n=1 Tax=Thauera humireducens TaxID=1134435 RepID=A0A127K3U9_9RHOO|nr:hypothetical protein [Thauera humireducens]AMO36632.1 hypothetical protein AC731_006565 [Thauera humireducens]
MSLIKDAWDIIKERSEWKAMQAAAQKVPELEARIAKLEAALANGAAGNVCDHCASPRLTRTGSRNSRKLPGAKEAIFKCDDCGDLSAFTIPAPR